MSRRGGPIRRVSIVGNSGSGKTTLARALAERLGVPHIELDQLNHQPGWQERTAEELRAAVTPLLAGDGWVVDGNYRRRVGNLVTAAADTVVWLDYPRAVVMSRIVRRTIRRVVTRQELWNGNREPFSNLWSLDPQRSVVAWSWTQHHAYRRQYEAEMLDADAGPSYLRHRTPAETRRWLAGVVQTGAPSR